MLFGGSWHKRTIQAACWVFLMFNKRFQISPMTLKKLYERFFTALISQRSDGVNISRDIWLICRDGPDLSAGVAIIPGILRNNSIRSIPCNT